MSRVAGMVIGWMPHSQRSRTIAVQLGFELLLLGRPGFRRPWTAAITYPLLTARTLLLMARMRPRAIVVVAPPFVAPLIVLPLARLLRTRVAIDIHSGAVLDRRWRWSLPILRWTCRRADAAVTTLASLANRLPANGTILVIPDPLPEFRVNDTQPRDPSARPRVVAVCGWGDDEPITALLDAVRGQPWDVVLTGKSPLGMPAPDNVRLTGFLDDDAYLLTLESAAVVVVLTTREETLLSGAWEALAVGRPLVVSATLSLRETFGPEVARAEPTAPSIRGAIALTLDDADAANRSRRLARRFRAANASELQRLVAALDGDPSP